MNKMELYVLLSREHPEKIAQKANELGIHIEPEEVRLIQQVLEHFPIWTLLGDIPNELLYELTLILGKKRTKQLLTIFNANGIV